MYKFLVLQTAFTGDVVLATAIVEKLHQYYPDARIDFLLRKGNEDLLKGHPYISEVIVWNKKKDKYRNLLKMILYVRKEKYTHVINPHRFLTSGLMCYFSGAGYTAGFNKNPMSWSFTKVAPHVIAEDYSTDYILETERYQLLIEDITDKVAVPPKLHPSVADNELVQQFLGKPFVTISPSSVWFTKRYPIPRWAELIRLLPPDLKVYLLGGPPDKELCESIKVLVPERDVENMCGRLSYLQSASLMKYAAMNYTNDSAPLHFASAMNAPVTGVFCSTISSFGFGPQSDVSTIVELDHKIECRPCGLHGRKTCPRGHFKCAMDIRNEQLLWWTLK